MDNLSLFSALNGLRIGARVEPLWDDDLRALYAARLAEHRAIARARPRAVIHLAVGLERPAGWLRRPADEPAPRSWHA